MITVLMGFTMSDAGQVMLDGSFGTSGSLTGPSYDIPASVGKTVGNNLFHSFSQFDLSSTDIATFSGPDSIQNILSRVTGMSRSSIDGTIQSTIPGANFYFMNPNGVMFGPNAKVDVSGSFVVTTANYIKLADGGRFDASNPADDTLMTAHPAAFGFLGPEPAAIELLGPGGQDPPPVLALVPDGETIALIGGQILIVNEELDAPSGRVALVSLGSDGEIEFDTESIGAAVDTSDFSELGDLIIEDLSVVLVSGDPGGRVIFAAENVTLQNNVFIFAEAGGAQDGLGVEINARDGLTLLSGALIQAGTADVSRGGDIRLSAGSVHLDGQAETGGSGAVITTGSLGAGRSGDIVVETGLLLLENGAGIQAIAGGTGDGGNIDITASTILLDGHGFDARISADTFFEGLGGSITIHADTIEIVNLGDILAQTHGLSTGGNIEITTKSLNLRNQGHISASTDGPGIGGSINITASSISIDGGGDSSLLTGIAATAGGGFFGGGGDGGDIFLHSGADGMLLIDVANGGQISVTSGSDGGDGGDITIETGRISLRNQSSIQAAAVGAGSAGGILLSMSDTLLLEQGSSISVSADQSSGGDIHVNAGNDIRLKDSQITAQAFQDGGSITLLVPATTDGVKLSGQSQVNLLNSQITAAAAQGNGGNVTIDPQFVILDHSQILASAIVGNGGNIDITTKFLLSSASVIDASSQFGLQGSVEVTAPDVDLSGSLLPLSGSLVDAASQLQERCAVRLPDDASSFVVVGSGGTPVEPDNLIPSFPLGGAKRER